jgi:hypothetical protein
VRYDDFMEQVAHLLRSLEASLPAGREGVSR